MPGAARRLGSALITVMLCIGWPGAADAATLVTAPMDAGRASDRGTTYVECIIRNTSPSDLTVTVQLWDSDRLRETSGFELPPGEFAILKGRHVTGWWHCAFILQGSQKDGRAFAIATTVTPSVAIPVVIPAR